MLELNLYCACVWSPQLNCKLSLTHLQIPRSPSRVPPSCYSINICCLFQSWFLSLLPFRLWKYITDIRQKLEMLFISWCSIFQLLCKRDCRGTFWNRLGYHRGFKDEQAFHWHELSSLSVLPFFASLHVWASGEGATFASLAVPSALWLLPGRCVVFIELL